MTQLAGTTDTYRIASGGGIREDLEDTIWDLFPNDTWALTNLEKVEASNAFHEWLGDNLAGATINRQLEGDDASFSTFAQATRYGNYQQISRKTFLISRTLDAVAKAGRRKESARAQMKSMRELKRDMELALIGNQASSSGGSATTRSSAGLESWIATTDNGGNGVKATTSASGSTAGFSSGTVAAPVDGSTTGAIAEAKFAEMLGLVWADGADPRIVLAGQTQKNAINAFAGIATRFVDVVPTKQATITGAADMYVSSYGKHTIVLHRYMRSSVVLAFDPDYLAVSYIDKPFMEELAKTGDGRKFQVISEFGLVVRNPNAAGKVYACT